MEFPPRAGEIIDAFYHRHRGLAEGSADQQRVLTRWIGEQLAFELGPQWGCKASSPTNPQGLSTIAFNGPPLSVWRWSDGDGSVTGIIGAPLHPPLLMPLDQTVGQHFIACEPIDHLGISAMPEPSAPWPTPTPVPVDPPAPPPVSAVPAPPSVEPPSGLQTVLSAVGAWLGTQLGTWVSLWLQRRKAAPPKTGPGTAIPRPTIPTRSNLPK